MLEARNERAAYYKERRGIEGPIRTQEACCPRASRYQQTLSAGIAWPKTEEFYDHLATFCPRSWCWLALRTWLLPSGRAIH
jgi:hypothetical protein